MIAGVLAAVVACLAYGVSSVLQAYGARRSAVRAQASHRGGQVTASGAPRLTSTVAAALTGWFLLGSALDVIGFLGGAAAARLIPLFLSQTILSANLIVTALLGIVVLGNRMRRRDWLAVAMVIVGLAILAAAAGEQGSVVAARSGHWAVLFAVTLILVLGQLLVRRLGAGAAATAGLLAGLLFGALAVAVRIAAGLAPLHPGVLVADPAAWAIVVAGVGGFYLHTVALQLGSVNGATAALVVGETVLPGLVGVVALGDSARAGLGWLAGVGFVLAVTAAVAVVGAHSAAAPPTPPAPQQGASPGW